MARAVAWNAAASWAAQILSWASTIVVARLLTPFDYGVIGMASLYLNLALLISQAGIADAVIALRDLTDREISELNTVGLIMSFGLAGVTCALAKPISRFFSSPPLYEVLLISSAIYLFNAFQIVPKAILQKQLRFKLLASIDTIRAVLQISATVLFAFLGFRYWSLVIGYITSSASVSLLTYCYVRQPFAWPRFRLLRRELKFSRQALLSRVAVYAYDNADFGVAGRVLGEAPLGNYTIAWTISSAPVEKIANLVMAVTPAYFSTLQNDKPQLRRYLLRLTELLSFITLPASVGIAISANYLVPALLGPKWHGVIGPLRLLGLFVAVRSVATILPNLLTAIGDAGFVMWASLASTVVMPISFFIGSHWGTSGIAAAWAIAYPPMMLPLYWRVFKKIEMRVGDYWRAISPAASASAIMAVAVLVASRMIPGSFRPVVTLALIILVGAVTYGGALFAFHRRRVVQLVRGVRGILAKKGHVAVASAEVSA
jgi:O-antigen/teichoic acid export membrane protein